MDPNGVSTPEQRHDAREVVGLFDTVDKMQSAIDDLLTGGFDRSEISLLAGLGENDLQQAHIAGDQLHGLVDV